MYNFFFEIPVYRLSEEKYYKDMDDHINKHELFQKSMDPFYQRNPDLKSQYMDYTKKKFGGMWLYNEIIGYIRLCVSGSQILGWYCQNAAKKQCKTRKKQFEYVTYKLTPELDLPWDVNSEDIYLVLLEYLKNCKNELRNRFIDSSNFEKIGPFVDWKKLIWGNCPVNKKL
jgi:hypothetical protein